MRWAILGLLAVLCGTAAYANYPWQGPGHYVYSCASGGHCMLESERQADLATCLRKAESVEEVMDYNPGTCRCDYFAEEPSDVLNFKR